MQLYLDDIFIDFELFVTQSGLVHRRAVAISCHVHLFGLPTTSFKIVDKELH